MYKRTYSLSNSFTSGDQKEQTKEHEKGKPKAKKVYKIKLPHFFIFYPFEASC